MRHQRFFTDMDKQDVQWKSKVHFITIPIIIIITQRSVINRKESQHYFKVFVYNVFKEMHSISFFSWVLF